MIKFTELIEASFEWTVTQLLRPFRLKKWIMLALCAALAGTLTYQSLNIGLPGDWEDMRSQKEETVAEATGSPESPVDEWRQIKAAVVEFKSQPYALPVVSGVALLIVGLVVLLTWFCSRFALVFLENIVTNDASITVPFRNNKRLGNSYFRFNLVASIASLLPVIGVLWVMIQSLRSRGVFENVARADLLDLFFTLMPYIFILGGIWVAAVLVWVMASDVMLVAMYKEKKTVLQVFAPVWRFIVGHVKELLLYLVIKTGLSIGLSFVYGIAALAVLFGLMLPIAIIGLSIAAGIAVIPPAYQWIWITVTAIIVIPVVFAMQLFFMCLQLPIAVFFRTFSMKFVGRLNPAWDLSVE